ncbi:hypothetical protein CCAX7_44510 [Capsulimonas corticalis]|uniref:Uncharacterized protein n=1 Tax=Capsulimonas corticalis TaxID=2219043 RepID=A0A402CX40_9BACT|nr:hypothetical protein [Capsulimonas corticalis]BDI32400.1 hypothetical protein CCAX7_44510 [Capsulimonas corticalis]
MSENTIWHKLQNIDRRIIYALLILSIVIPLFVPSISIPGVPSQQSKDFYNTIETIAKTDPDKIVIVSGMWSSGTRGENKWQTQAILTHLMMRHIHFAIISFDAQNNELTQQIADKVSLKYHYQYGVDYINWGYRPNSVFPQVLKGLVTNIPGTIKKDMHDRDVTKFPVMKDIKSIKDVKAIIDITPVSSLETWLGLVQGANNTPMLYAPTAVMAPDSYPYLDSHQVSGLLTGVKGAGDYEGLTGVKAFATRGAGALSLVYALIIFLVILGNIGYQQGRIHARRTQE